jgi:hypothetical protein
MQNKIRRSVRLNVEILEERALPSSSIGGFVFADANNNGVADVGETALVGVSVNLTGHDNHNHSVKLTQKTDANGTFNFANLAPGVYSLQESSVTGYIDGLTSAGSQGGATAIGSISNITLPNGVSDTGNNLGYLAKSAGWTSIQSNFNGTAVRSGDTLWFSSDFTAAGLGNSPDQSIDFVRAKRFGGETERSRLDRHALSDGDRGFHHLRCRHQQLEYDAAVNV